MNLPPLNLAASMLLPIHLEIAYEQIRSVPAAVRIVRMPPRQLATFLDLHRRETRDLIDHLWHSYAFENAPDLQDSEVHCWTFCAGKAEFLRKITNIGIPTLGILNG